MTDTPARLLKLLSLLQTPHEWPGSELAERLGVSSRTVRRDIERLRDLGYPVRATMGKIGGYRLIGGTAMPPLLLDDEEAVAIAVGLRAAAGQPVSGIEDASLRALAKLEQVLPPRLRRRVATLGVATAPMRASEGPLVDSHDLAVVALAVAGREKLRFAYAASDGTESRRHVEPNQIVASGRRWYLLAFDNDRDDWRVFRVDRIRRPQATGARHVPRTPPGGAAAFVTERLRSLLPTYPVRATLHLPIEEAQARLGTGPGELEAVDDRTCCLRGRADTLDWLAARLLMLGCDFTVHEPPELVEHLRALADRAVRATGGRH